MERHVAGRCLPLITQERHSQCCGASSMLTTNRFMPLLSENEQLSSTLQTLHMFASCFVILLCLSSVQDISAWLGYESCVLDSYDTQKRTTGLHDVNACTFHRWGSVVCLGYLQRPELCYNTPTVQANSQCTDCVTYRTRVCL